MELVRHANSAPAARFPYAWELVFVRQGEWVDGELARCPCSVNTPRGDFLNMASTRTRRLNGFAANRFPVTECWPSTLHGFLSDLCVSSTSLDLTFAITHEREWPIGPFYAEASWQQK